MTKNMSADCPKGFTIIGVLETEVLNEVCFQDAGRIC